VNRDELLAYCLAKPGAYPDQPWENDVVAKVGGKIFAFTGEHTLGVKCGRSSEEAGEVRDRYPNEATVMAYIGRYGWNTIRTEGTIPEAELVELIDESYDAVVSRLPRSRRP
jgi:predicted DNA-binding protein (MmcQ/YjbR family)